MTLKSPALPCFLVEWYRPELTEEVVDEAVGKLSDGAASMTTAGMPVQLLMTLAIPTDEVLYCVFAATSANLVAQACDRAGWPAARLTNAVDTRIAAGG